MLVSFSSSGKCVSDALTYRKPHHDGVDVSKTRDDEELLKFLVSASPRDPWQLCSRDDVLPAILVQVLTISAFHCNWQAYFLAMSIRTFAHLVCN